MAQPQAPGFDRITTGNQGKDSIDKQSALKGATQGPSPEWPHFIVSADAAQLDLDTSYPALVPGGLVVLTGASGPVVFTVTSVQDKSRTAFALTARVTSLGLKTPLGAIANLSPRSVPVLAGSEQLTLVGAPVAVPVAGTVIDLADDVTTLPPGRAVVVSGRAPLLRIDDATVVLTAESGAPLPLVAGDLLTVTGPARTGGAGTVWPVTGSAGTGTVLFAPGQATFLPAAADQPQLVELGLVADHQPSGVQLQAPLTHAYDRAGVQISANVAPASHGETKHETLGSGDATLTFQEFTLAQSPLTYVGDTSTGVSSTLQVDVGGNQWQEVRSLFGSGPADRVYTVRIAADDTVTVGFGDGLTGARLPTGPQNVTATYRVGTGRVGAVDAGQLTLLMTRPLGVRGVTNPMPAGLAADPDAPDMVRRNAPRTALAFDRVVSLLDYEDFVRAIPGFAKAQATPLVLHGHRTVHVTVVGEQGAAVSADEAADLITTIRGAGDPRQAVAVTTADQIGCVVALTCVVDPHVVPGSVKAAVESTLLQHFGFDARDLAQPITATEVVAVAQSVPGVVGVILTTLDLAPGGERRTVLPASGAAATSDGTAILAAQLLTLSAGQLSVVEAT